MLTTICLRELEICVSCNFNCPVKSEELFKVTGSHIHYGNFSAMV